MNGLHEQADVQDGLDGRRVGQGRRGPGRARVRQTLSTGQIPRLVHGTKVLKYLNELQTPENILSLCPDVNPYSLLLITMI